MPATPAGPPTVFPGSNRSRPCGPGSSTSPTARLAPPTATRHFDDAMLDRAARAFDNDDYVDVVIHSYRHRLGLAPGHAPYVDIERRLAGQPPITVPTITLDGQADGNFPATDGTASAAHFTGPRTHRQVPNAGHNLPQEAPQAFADAVLDLANSDRTR